MIKRELYMSRIRPFIGNELIKILTGLRRSGKSVMLELIKQELRESGISDAQFISYNFEQMSNAHLCSAEALYQEVMNHAAKMSGKIYLFFDEIQEVAHWEKCINSFRVDFDCDIYLTGSNAKLLSGELATYLAGRYVEFIIYPFSFSEFLELYQTVFPGVSAAQCFSRYLTEGGMPYLSNLRYEAEPSRQYLQDLYNSVVLKDIVKRNKIRDVDLLERIIAYLTGSNAKLLSGELATYLAGRYVEFIIYPFSFSEFLELYQTVFPGVSAAQCFSRYLTEGGMPYLSNLRYEAEPSRQYLQDLYNSVVLKDIVKRNKIRDVDLLERIIAYLTANIGTTFSATSVSKYLKSEGRNVSPETILNYIKACESAFLFYRVKRQDVQGKKILAVQEKYYIADHGIREAVFGGNMRDINLILENLVYMELLRRGYQVTVGKAGDREIDFIGEKQNQKLYIQVAYLLASEETIQREFGVYNHVRDNFPKYVVSLDEFDMSRDGIKHRNIRDFLTASEWN